jgi:hypothetical protein
MSEQYEINLSAIVDGELSGEELKLTIDALVKDEELRNFWGECRYLEKGITESTQEKINLPESGWNDIEKKSGLNKPKIFRLNSVPSGAWVAAASVVILVIFAVVGVLDTSFLTQPGVDTIDLAQGNEMSDDRFLNLTKELLQADSKYHRQMYEVLTLVNQQAYGIVPQNDANVELASNDGTDAVSEDETSRRRRRDNSSNAIDLNLW